MGSAWQLNERDEHDFGCRVFVPGDEFFSVQFSVVVHVKCGNDRSGAFLRIAITFAVADADEIVLKTERTTAEQVRTEARENCTMAEMSSASSF